MNKKITTQIDEIVFIIASCFPFKNHEQSSTIQEASELHGSESLVDSGYLYLVYDLKVADRTDARNDWRSK